MHKFIKVMIILYSYVQIKNHEKLFFILYAKEKNKKTNKEIRIVPSCKGWKR